MKEYIYIRKSIMRKGRKEKKSEEKIYNKASRFSTYI
jgi:hypothetical protein